jgi:bifunctional UDP-N-acetylglucosamine pyrophosphorylase/glucosamine-1-phosphate N-acetyltransferase
MVIKTEKKTGQRPLWAVVLAAGEGTRMKSEVPKPLTMLCGKPMVLWILDALAELTIDKIVIVVGHKAEQVTSTISQQNKHDLKLDFVDQIQQRGTGDAVAVSLTALPDLLEQEEGDILVLPSDAPLITANTLKGLLDYHKQSQNAATILSTVSPDPTGYGRIIRGKNSKVLRIVEESDATHAEKEIKEICTSIYVFKHSVLGPALRRLVPSNFQREYYLTDTIEVLASAGYQVDTYQCENPLEVMGVNDKAQLACVEKELRLRINTQLMKNGVRIIDPENTYISSSVSVSPSTDIYPGCYLEGDCQIGANCIIGPDCFLSDTIIEPDCTLIYCHIKKAEIGQGSQIGPFSVVLPGSKVEPGSVIGPFEKFPEK